MNFISEFWLLFKYIFLGFIQGFTEPIPISSSGHLVIFRELFGMNIKGLSFEILVHSGSLIAIIFVYRKDIISILTSAILYVKHKDQNKRSDFNFLILLFIATLITGILGLLLEEYISNSLAGVAVVGITLFITGVALWIIRNLRGYRNDEDLTVKDAVIVGLAQAVALIPGISRSGATIVAGMLLGMKKKTALRFSFLLFIPVSIGITILSIGDMVNDPNFDMLAIPYLLAFMSSLIATFYSLKWFIHIMVKGNLKYFSFYCFIVGTLVIIFL